MKVLALMTVRNEALYLRRCLEHLLGEGIEVCVIDNDSSDGSGDIAREYAGMGVSVEHFAYPGHFDLRGILRNEERLARELDADWFLHCDGDEIREAPLPFATLHQGVLAADAAGANAINFDEFLFFPMSNEVRHEGTDYVAGMRDYYYFAPSPLRRVNLWKRTGAPVDLASSGGHSAAFAGRRVYPQNFVMRHYIAMSHAHAVDKYARQRTYSPDEVVGLGWHGLRAKVRGSGDIVLPPPERMHRLTGRDFDRSRPERLHLFFNMA
jgi:glycosyltransferase involved in cell wall biosynthesis